MEKEVRFSFIRLLFVVFFHWLFAPWVERKDIFCAVFHVLTVYVTKNPNGQTDSGHLFEGV